MDVPHGEQLAPNTAGVHAPLEPGELLKAMLLYVYDTSDPSNPTALAEPQIIPVTITFDIDPYAGILGL
ncbi:MAG: hypothetical protein QGF21_14570, partial [Vicinamibacterales bacterium]|nr:hypothetical protein [Vicinamibacterales bacterium]